MGFLDGIGSILTGGLTGLLGAVVQKVADYKTEKLKAEVAQAQRAHEIELRKADAAILEQEWTQRVRLAQTESAGKEAVADSEAFRASFELEPKQYSAGVAPTPAQAWLLLGLDCLRGVIRPGLTIYLCVLTTMIYVQARALLGSSLPPGEALPIVKEIIQTVLFLTTTTATWWFGLRGKGVKQ